jgi:hypothetical protein
VAKGLITMREGGYIDEYLAAAALLELGEVASPIAEAALLAAGRSIAGLDRPPAEPHAEPHADPHAGATLEPMGRPRATGRAPTLAGRAGTGNRQRLAGGRA